MMFHAWIIHTVSHGFTMHTTFMHSLLPGEYVLLITIIAKVLYCDWQLTCSKSIPIMLFTFLKGFFWLMKTEPPSNQLTVLVYLFNLIQRNVIFSKEGYDKRTNTRGLRWVRDAFLQWSSSTSLMRTSSKLYVGSGSSAVTACMLMCVCVYVCLCLLWMCMFACVPGEHELARVCDCVCIENIQI